MPDLAPGSEFAGCRIEAVAGRGGMGVVYRATELSLGRPVALKLLADDRAGDPDFRERFQRESRMAAAIDHPNVIPVYGAGEEDGCLYLVMRYVGGTDLQALLRSDGALAPDRSAELVAQVASALDAAHAAGLVHRDVKPANVLLAGEHAYLSDFGLTRLAGSDRQITESGQWIGTVEYCSPEQLRGDGTDAHADVYSLGCVLFAALTGGPPFSNGTVPGTMLAHLHDAPPRPSGRGAPQEFDRVIARALEKTPADRYPSAGDLGRAALAAARGEPVTESERSVARGSAAPHGTNGSADRHRAPDGNGTNGAADRHRAPGGGSPGRHRALWSGVDQPTAEPRAERTAAGRSGATAVDGESPPELPRVIHGRRRSRPALAVAALFIALVALGLALGQIFDEPSLAARTGPLSDDEVRAAALAFAEAYAAEDTAALGRAVTRDVVRVLPGGRTEGRRAVVEQYERQFDGRVGGYDLTDLEVDGGRAGRASGSYRVDREGGEPYEGTIVLGIVRERGFPRIRLIAATPTP